MAVKKTLMAAVVMWGATAWAGPGTQAVERTVTVCLAHPPDEVTDRAKLVASRIFSRIQVNLEWHNDARFCQAHPDQAIVISYSHHTPKEMRPGALAVALPFEGIHIEIFYDRIRAAEGFVPPDYLGHVLAHEITHILQSVARHSDSGLMKAHWDRPELVQMKDHLYLSFTNDDVDLIYAGMARRAAAIVAAANRVE
jgi:hypothetical protein